MHLVFHNVYTNHHHQDESLFIYVQTAKWSSITHRLGMGIYETAPAGRPDSRARGGSATGGPRPASRSGPQKTPERSGSGGVKTRKTYGKLK